MWKTISNKYVLCFSLKGGYSFRRFGCNGELIPDCWCNYTESMFTNIELSFREEKLLESDDLRVLEISEKYSR